MRKGFVIDYRKATQEDLESIWNRNIIENADDVRWVGWKSEYISYNQSGMAQTFVVLCDNMPIGEGTLLFSPWCNAVNGRTKLADNENTANVNALRISREYEGKGYISKLIRMMENDAVQKGYTRMTIGVEAQETRNLAIYLHWGYDKFVTAEMEEGTLILYYAKEIL